jgi:hypothetical protein
MPNFATVCISIKCEIKMKQFYLCSMHSFSTLQGKSHLCISFLGIARPQSQFSHSCVCERLIYSQDWFTFFPAVEFADGSWKYIISQIFECREHYNSVLEITVSFLGIHKFISDFHRPFICSVS